ncbi:hypothetical protein FLM48_09765 [Shewanella sp. Scap07]|uniref:hypothetical protein n=1 Tax=Shewanella sp. Scap07 TaxID=2589987 RepID=UPI0015B7E877|nr:hypothetical protein [Shewanella sp. Scap07]QLE85344.1 hypothetical protein FLM48_09765 [Shewanella sp. Scap07]
MADDRQREIKRVISGWLTEKLNELGGTQNQELEDFKSQVRSIVLVSLERINLRLHEINRTTKQKFSLQDGIVLSRFYIKGGNAFRFTVENQQGKSDWDTQIVINPWLPEPLTDTLYALIEDAVLDEFYYCSEQIGQASDLLLSDANHSFSEVIKNFWLASDLKVNPQDTTQLPAVYLLEYPPQQSIKRVFAHNKAGLWDYDSRPMMGKTTGNQSGPGMVFNDAIPPFVLYRLGYVWTTKIQENEIPTERYPLITSPILMEIIDVTIPRKNTIEAIGLWDEIQAELTLDTLPIPVPVTDDVLGYVSQVSLPFPNKDYHCAEQLTMLGEVADGSSKHADKKMKRFKRFGTLWASLDVQQRERMLSHVIQPMMGINDIHRYVIQDPIWLQQAFQDVGAQDRQTITPLIDLLSNGHFIIGQNQGLTPTENAYVIALMFMDNVHYRSIQATPVTEQQLQFYEAIARQVLGNVQTRLRARNITNIDIEEAAFSGDSMLQQSLTETGLFNLDPMPLSGVASMFYIPVTNKEAIELCTELLIDELMRPGVNIPPANIQYRTHNEQQLTRLSFAATTCVYNDVGQVKLAFTFSSATVAESPLLSPFKGTLVKHVNAKAMAEQRRVAAGMVKDYVVRTAFAKQIEMLDSILPAD